MMILMLLCAKTARTDGRGIFQYVDLTAPNVAAGKKIKLDFRDNFHDDFFPIELGPSSFTIKQISAQTLNLKALSSGL